MRSTRDILLLLCVPLFVVCAAFGVRFNGTGVAVDVVEMANGLWRAAAGLAATLVGAKIAEADRLKRAMLGLRVTETSLELLASQLTRAEPVEPALAAQWREAQWLLLRESLVLWQGVLTTTITNPELLTKLTISTLSEVEILRGKLSSSRSRPPIADFLSALSKLKDSLEKVR